MTDTRKRTIDEFKPTNPPAELQEDCTHDRIGWERNFLGFTQYRVCVMCGAQER